MMNIQLVTNSYFSYSDQELQEIAAIAPGSRVMTIPETELSEETVATAEIIYGWPRVDLLPHASCLKWLQLPSAGANGYTDKSAYCNSDIIVTSSSGVYGLSVTEHVFSFILAFNRQLPFYLHNQRERCWKRTDAARDFLGSTVGIIGLGDIGTEIAKRAKAWGANVIALKRHPAQKPEYIDILYSIKDLDLLLAQSDYVILAVPETPETKGIISKERLGKMKADAILINVGRGTLVDQEALIEALKTHRIGGAGLDVTDPEPLPADHPLWTLSNVIITSHSAGISPHNHLKRLQIFKQNLNRYIKGAPLINIVDFNAGY